MDLKDFLPLPWYVAGPMIGLTIPLLYYFANKPLGISYVFKQLCAFCVKNSKKVEVNQKLDYWRLFFVSGIVVAGIIHHFIIGEYSVRISEKTIDHLAQQGINHTPGFQPLSLWNIEALDSLKQWILIILGGLLIGFGTRYAGGCTSGHTIMGLSNLSPASLLATISFFIGGLISANFLLPYLNYLFQ